MIDLKNENEIETVRIANGNQMNISQKLGNYNSGREMHKRNSNNETIKITNGELAANHKESEFVNVSLLYGFKNLPTFVKYFSISEIIKNASNQLEEMVNGVVVMVNTSDVIIRQCDWNLKEFNKSYNLERLEENLTINFLIQFIRNLRNSSLKSKASFHVYKFDEGKNTKLISDFETDSLKSEENENQNLQKIKNILLCEVVKNFNSNSKGIAKSNKCELNEALSKIYNIENNFASSHRGKNSRHFLRIIILAGFPSSQIDSTKYCTVMSTYNNKKSKIRAGIVNLLLMENDFYLSNLSPDHDLLKFSDNNNTKISLLQSSEKMNAICEFYENVELEIKELSDKILDYGRSYFEWNTNPSSVKKNSRNVEIIKEFVKKLDSDLKLFSDLVEAVTKNISDLNKNDTRRDVLQLLQKKVEDLVDGIIISKVINVLQKSLEEFYTNKSLKDNIFKEIKNEIKSFYENVSRIEKKISREDLCCYYWKEKIDFLTNQINVIDQTFLKIFNLDILFSFLGEQLKIYINENYTKKKK